MRNKRAAVVRRGWWVILLGAAACGAVPSPYPLATLAVPTPIYQVTPGPDEVAWELPGSLGLTHAYVGTLTALETGARQTILILMTGLWPVSPLSGSRQVSLTLRCQGVDADRARWHVKPAAFETPAPPADLACGESTSATFSYDHAFRRLLIELPAGALGALSYTLTASVHGPY